MSKKKRKTRKEKEFVKHDFKTASQGEEVSMVSQAETKLEQKNTNREISGVKGFVYDDLKKVLIIIGVIIAMLIILAILVYKTTFLAPLFNLLKIKY